MSPNPVARRGNWPSQGRTAVFNSKRTPSSGSDVGDVGQTKFRYQVMTIEEFQRRAAHVSISQKITRTYSNIHSIYIYILSDQIHSKLFFSSGRLVFEAANNRRFDQQNWKSCAQCVRHSIQCLINFNLKRLCWEYRNSDREEYEGIPCCCIHLDWAKNCLTGSILYHIPLVVARP